MKCIVYQCVENSREAWNCKGNIKLLVFRLECPNSIPYIHCEGVLFSGLTTMTLHVYLHQELWKQRKKTTSTSSIAMAQVVSHWPVTADTHIWSQARPCGIFGGWSGSWTGFIPSTSVSSVIIIQPAFRIHVSFLYHWHYIILNITVIITLKKTHTPTQLGFLLCCNISIFLFCILYFQSIFTSISLKHSLH